MTEPLAHPIRPAPAAQARPLLRHKHRAAGAPWHFVIGLPGGSIISPGAPRAPAPRAPALLGRFEIVDPPATIEVIGDPLTHEVDPAAWLAGVLECEGKTVVSSKGAQTLTGRAGDIVACWTADGQALAGRFAAGKQGRELFAISCVTRREDYPRAADDFLRILGSFRPLGKPQSLLAEPMRLLVQPKPVLHRLLLPKSWIFHGDPVRSGRVSAFQAAQVPAPPPDAPKALTHLYGRLSFAVADIAEARSPRDAANRYLDMVQRAGVSFDSEAFVEREHLSAGPTGRRLEGAWRLVTTATMGEFDAELRCDVLLFEGVWVVAGVVGPRREVALWPWMRNTRALDVVTQTLAFLPERD